MFEIPEDHLPPGFADTVDQPPAQPAPPRPAATVVLLRSGTAGVEVLLMRRHSRSRFVPGAWVFPGGKVDAADSAPPLYQRIRGLPSQPVPESAFWTAALRELFEETGVLMARGASDEWARDATSQRAVEAQRRALMEDQVTLMDVLDELDLTLDARGMVHIAHWVTPVVERRRYDTHFFATALPHDRTAAPDPREMSEAAWIAPRAALERFERGELPMVFPTVRTLETLREFRTAEDVLASFRGRTVTRILPRLIRTDTGVAIVTDNDGTTTPGDDPA